MLKFFREMLFLYKYKKNPIRLNKIEEKEELRMNRYFIAYTVKETNGNITYGNLVRSEFGNENGFKEIKGMEDIIHISRDIEKHCGFQEKSVVIINFFKMD